MFADSGNFIYVARWKYNNLEQRSDNEFNLSFGGQGDLVIDTSNAGSVFSASNLELEAVAEEDLVVARKSHLEYLSGFGRSFSEFLADI